MAQLPNFPHILQNGPGNVPDADQVMDNYQHVRDYLNGKQLEPSDLAPGAAGQIIVCNASGVPQYVTPSGDVDVSTAGALTLTDAVQEELGLSDDDATRRGKSIIATEQARSNPAYGVLPTPDQVEAVVLPTDGLIAVAYQAAIKSSTSGAGRAAIFLNSTQLKACFSTVGLQNSEVTTQGTDTYRLVSSAPFGLVRGDETYAAPVTTGQAISGVSDLDALYGGVCLIFAAAGTYTVSVRFRATTGSVTAKDRKLWTWTTGF